VKLTMSSLQPDRRLIIGIAGYVSLPSFSHKLISQVDPQGAGNRR
jgi:hypothetical protein